MLEPERDIGILGSIFGHALDAYHIHRELLRALAYKRLDGYRAVVKISLGQEVHIMARLGVDKVVQKHSIYLAATHLDTYATQYHNVELNILSYLCNALILKYRAQNIGILLATLGIKRQVPRLAPLYGKR